MAKKTKSSKIWLQEHVTDPFVKRAKAEGYRSRASFKIKEILERDALIRPGAFVVDLGATPGGWSQVLAEHVGPKGRVIAVDILPMKPLSGVEFVQGDFTDDHIFDQLLQLTAGRKLDLVFSDIAPNLSGEMEVDQARQMYLAEIALDFAEKTLVKGGGFLVKVFEGEGMQEYRQRLKQVFKVISVRKPAASRARSREFYLLAKHFDVAT